MAAVFKAVIAKAKNYGATSPAPKIPNIELKVIANPVVWREFDARAVPFSAAYNAAAVKRHELIVEKKGLCGGSSTELFTQTLAAINEVIAIRERDVRAARKAHYELHPRTEFEY